MRRFLQQVRSVQRVGRATHPRLARSLRVLGIETSCDDTGVAVVDLEEATGARKVVAESVSSQFDLLQDYAGVVPVLAARRHNENLPVVCDHLQRKMQVAGESMESIDAVAVAAGPGLALCLKVGFEGARSLADQLQRPLIRVNHLEAHALVPRLAEPTLAFPYLLLLASGGHTMAVLVQAPGRHVRLGSTRDDSVGECFDKVARMVEVGRWVAPSDKGGWEMHTGECESEAEPLSDPPAVEPATAAAAAAGNRADESEPQLKVTPVESISKVSLSRVGARAPSGAAVAGHQGAALEFLARSGNAAAVPLPVPLTGSHYVYRRRLGERLSIKGVLGHRRPGWLPSPELVAPVCEFSFSGLKSAVSRQASAVEASDGAMSAQRAADIAASFQESVCKHLQLQLDAAFKAIAEGGVAGVEVPPTALVVSGGVAANERVRSALAETASAHGVPLVAPPIRLCTDNGTMVAWAAAERLAAGNAEEATEGADFSPRWPLGDPMPTYMPRRSPPAQEDR